ncbi:MAG TPA: hypothetical protein VF656_00195 [Pyrinomonadaceae bacterium]
MKVYPGSKQRRASQAAAERIAGGVDIFRDGDGRKFFVLSPDAPALTFVKGNRTALR